jgi:hypothetical protein
VSTYLNTSQRKVSSVGVKCGENHSNTLSSSFFINFVLNHLRHEVLFFKKIQLMFPFAGIIANHRHERRRRRRGGVPAGCDLTGPT